MVASFINLNGIVSNCLLPHILQSAKYGRLLIAVYIRLKKQGIVEENLENSLAACFGRRVEKLTRTSTFLLRFRFECALTIFLTVARGYSFWPAAIVERAAMAMAILVLLDPAVDEKEGFVVFFSLAPDEGRTLVPHWYRRSQSKASSSNPARLARLGKACKVQRYSDSELRCLRCLVGRDLRSSALLCLTRCSYNT
jgi:hypothetical protein